MLDLKFQSVQSIWTSKCGIFNFNRNIHMEKIHISDDDRIIFAKLTIPAEPDLLPINVLNIYAPADSSQNRAIFYNSLMNYIKFLDSYGDILERLILAGDFNFQYDLRLPNNAPTKRPTAFVLFTDTFFHDCNNNYSDSFFETLPTFRRGKVIKTLDYIMVGRQLKDLYFDNNIQHVFSAWTDYALLTIKLRLQLNNTGKGLWRANPNLVHYKSYVKKINSGISHFMQTILANSSDSNQIKWDRLKGYIRKLTKAYCSNRASWRKQRLKDLQSSRSQLIRQLKDDQEALQQELPKIEKPIARLEHEMALNATLKAGRLWLDNNEHSIGFLKKTGERRLAQRTMDTITHPTTEVPCTTTADKLEAVHAYYDVLYSPEPTHRYSMDKLLRGIQNTISVDDAEFIISSIDLDDILKSARQCPKVFTRTLNSRVIGAANKVITGHQAGFMPTRFIGDHGLALRLLMEDAQLHSNRSVGVIIDSAKAYDYVNEQYICKVLQKFGFPTTFITSVCNLFFKTKIAINVNGFMTESVSQKRGLRQGDSISPVLFNFALEPLLLAILNDEKIKGYSIHTAAVKSSSLQLVAPAPVKLLAYADDLLVLVNNCAEMQAIQDHISCYGRASNARVNYHKSVAFPLAGDRSRVGPDLFRLSGRLQFQWYDSDSPSYIKYLGYSIWFSKAQRDVFCNETILKLQASLDRHRTRSISVYGRANMVNSLFLARFWHMLRVTTLPTAFERKISSLVYQFACHKIVPTIKKSVIYLPKHVGGLSVIDIKVQQHILQQRYVRALLLDNQVSRPIPAFLMQLLCAFIQAIYGASHPQLPLLFRDLRFGTSLPHQHCLLPILRSMDAFAVEASWSDCGLSVDTLLQLPITVLFDPATTDPSLLYHKQFRQLPARVFLEQSRLPEALVFKARAACSSPGLLSRMAAAVHSNTIHFVSSLCPILLANPAGPEPLLVTGVGVDLSPYYCHKLSYQGIMIPSMSNTELRAMCMRDHPPITNPRVDVNRLTVASFLQTKMPSAARNLWFRLIHNKVSSRVNVYKIFKLPDGLCVYCGYRETTTHMLFTCPANRDI
ncbi:kinetochore-associated Ndc80 complex subunit nuf2 [Mucor velutinosus]|uniref:Kinetochore-associated Ndc80 complex subunit nuf2 n=1 Tax=Mucor velutinosus TaxID=708070 RepID=A0AAN7DL04_9FUNG|nr:kinetochore-associated Ndc80 complex subunit nuf2 [Mucor velutinosus]